MSQKVARISPGIGENLAEIMGIMIWFDLTRHMDDMMESSGVFTN